MRRAPIIHVVDDDEPFLIAVSRLLRVEGYAVHSYTNSRAFLQAGIEETPSCVLLDLHLAGSSGLDLQKALAVRSYPLPIIFLTAWGDIPTSVQAMKAGAVDFLTKPVRRDVLVETIQIAIAWSEKNRAAHQHLKHWRLCSETLTKSEAEVFAQVVAGKMNKEIAAELGMAVRTVKAHRGRLMQKMQVASVAELAHIANQLHNGKPTLATPA